MKIRNGFVSNSSTSSFLILGFKANLSFIEDQEKREEIIEDLCSEFECLEKYEYSKLKKNEIIIGVSLMDIKYGCEEFDHNNLNNFYKEFSKNKLLKKLNINIPPLKKCKMYGGVRGS